MNDPTGFNDKDIVMSSTQRPLPPTPLGSPLTMDEIIPNLYMGTCDPFLALKVNAIVDCQYLDLTALIPKPFLWIPFVDGPIMPPADYIKAAMDFIETMLHAGRSVLVHCAEGHNRSGLVVGAYLIWETGMHVDQAIALIRFKRGDEALSNETFVAALKAMEAQRCSSNPRRLPGR